jgi:hypothetical protein
MGGVFNRLLITRSKSQKNLISPLFKKQNNGSSTGSPPSLEPYTLISMNSEQLACGGGVQKIAQAGIISYFRGYEMGLCDTEFCRVAVPEAVRGLRDDAECA